MKVNSAVENILSELKFQARSVIIEKYSATDDQIGLDGFTYSVDGVAKYRHPYGAITTEIILSSLYNEMIYLCVQTVPLSLLERKGGTSAIVRNVNNTWDIRTPLRPIAGDDLDIDETLAQIAVFRTLSYLGVSAYTTSAKELLTTYKESLVVPSEEDSSDSLAFRFSVDGLEWHDTYQSGDMYFSIGRNAQWGNSIPVGGGGSGGSGATKFIELNDVPQVYTAGKILKANASGTGLVFADEQTAITKFLELSDTPKTYVAGKFLAVNGAGNAVSFVDAPTGSGQDALIGYQATMPYDFGVETAKQFITLDADTTFSVALNVDGLTPKMTKDTIYHMEVFLNGSTFSFNATQIKKPLSMPTLTGSEYAIIFNMIWDGDDIFAFNVNVYN